MLWRGVRVAEGARLEIVYGVKLIEGSTPSLSVLFMQIIPVNFACYLSIGRGRSF